ncbi:MAG: pilus assembly protein TadC [Clostridia bacterium]|nr:pilus assembly protein TadC [Clostridia bacterium]
MVFTITDIVIALAGVLTLFFWFILFFKGKKNESLFEPLEERDFPLKEIYFVGFAALEMFNYQYKSKSDRRLRRNLEVLYGPKYADYYLRVIHSQKITIGLTVLVLAFCLYGLADTVAILFVGVAFAFLAYYYFGTVTENKILKRSEEMLSDFSEVISKLALLTNAGMILREAWEEIAYTGQTSLYKEMQKAIDEMNNGVAEVDAIFNFGTRCIIPEIKKFASTIVQGLVKGNSELTIMLMEQSKEVWSAKKQNVHRQGEKASSKLLIPICIMFVGILVMILIPIFTNLGT